MNENNYFYTAEASMIVLRQELRWDRKKWNKNNGFHLFITNIQALCQVFYMHYLNPLNNM